MADVNALFANRNKKKKGKKKKILSNANELLTAEQRQDLDENGGWQDTAGGPGAKKKVTLFAKNDGDDADNGDEAEQERLAKFENLSLAMEDGEWVDDDDEEDVPRRQFLSKDKSRVVTELEDVSTKNEESAEPVSKETEDIRKQFHWTRKQALEAPEKKPEDPQAQVPPAKQVYVPRHVREAKARESGEAALGELDNELVFPSLGGEKKAANPVPVKSAWGKVAEDVIKDIEQAKTVPSATPVYLGHDFIASENFDGTKPGYAFQSGGLGVGYYWDGGDEAKLVGATSDENEMNSEDTTKNPENVATQAETSVPDHEATSTNPEADSKDMAENDDGSDFADLKKKKKKKKKKDIESFED